MNYMDQIKADVWNVIEDHPEWKEIDPHDLPEIIIDTCFDDDSVTGNGSGSYFFSRYQAKQQVFNDEYSFDYLYHAIADGELKTEELGYRVSIEDWEWIDVVIRCHLLSEVVYSMELELGD